MEKVKIYTQHQDRQTGLSVRYNIKTKNEFTGTDLAKSVACVSYIESLLDDFDTIVDLKISGKIKRSINIFLRQYDENLGKFILTNNTMEISNALTKEIDRYRSETKKSLSKKPLDTNHLLLFLTYELQTLQDVIRGFTFDFYPSFLSSIQSLVNKLNEYLSLAKFKDNLNIHKKRHSILSALHLYTVEALKVFDEAQQHLKEKQSNS